VGHGDKVGLGSWAMFKFAKDLRSGMKVRQTKHRQRTSLGSY
jgi:hypothetical protein